MDVAEFSATHWKVLELSFDCISVPYLIQQHRYSGLDTGDSLLPETTIDETASALRDLVAIGAVRVADETHTLSSREIEAVLGDPGSFDPVDGAFLIEVVNEPPAVDYLIRRPKDANPHRPAP